MALLQIAEPGRATAPHQHRLVVGIDLGTTNSLVAAVRNGATAVLPDAPLGYLTAYDADKPRLDRPIELWPRMQRRPVLLAGLAGEDYTRKRQVPPQVRNVRKLTHAYALFGAKPLPISFARRIMGLDHESAGEHWTWPAILQARPPPVPIRRWTLALPPGDARDSFPGPVKRLRAA